MKVIGFGLLFIVLGNVLSQKLSYKVIKIHSGNTGEWGVWQFCPYGSKAVAFSSYYQAEKGSTGFVLQCSHDFPYFVTSKADRTMETQFSQICSKGFTGVKVRQTTESGILEGQFLCDGMFYQVPEPAGYNIPTVSYGNPYNCSTGVICGIRSRLDSTNGLTGAEFACCESDSKSAITDTTLSCDFQDGTCPGWDPSNYTRIPFNAFDVGPFDYSVFMVAEGPLPGRDNSKSGPENGIVSPKYLFYESFIDAYQESKQPSLINVPRTYTSQMYDGSTWKSPNVEFYYHAYGQSLGDLYFEVLNSNDSVIQSQILFSYEIHDALHDQADKWYKIGFNIASLLNGNNGIFQMRLRVSNPTMTYVSLQSGDFAFDGLNFTYSVFDTCENSGCHSNATCVNAANIVDGFTCTCNNGFTGTGLNISGGCISNNTCDNRTVCMQDYSSNTCTLEDSGNYTCNCGNGFELSPDSLTCNNVNECTTGTASCGANADCIDTIGNYTCNCSTGYTPNPSNGFNNLDCDPNGGLSDWSLPGVNGSTECSLSCGGGTYNATRFCNNPAKEGFGLDCVGALYETRPCNTDECPASCPMWKTCTCKNVTAVYPGGALNMDLTFFPGLTANDLTFAMTKLSQWNQTVVEQVCRDANCEVTTLQTSITSISNDIETIGNVVNATAAAKLEMRDILDCNPANYTSHNEWLWDIFDKLCEYDAFLPNIKEDLSIKMELLTAEKDRCENRSTMRQLIELVYRKW